jgi:predicted ferric reductase
MQGNLAGSIGDPVMTAQPLTRAAVAVRQRVLPVPIPRDFAWLSVRDVWIVIAAIGGVIGAMWIRHGGLSRDPLTMIGEVSALAGTYAALIGVLFMSRAPWLDQVFGADALRGYHRWIGFITIWGLAAHALTSTLAYAGGSIARFVPEVLDLVATVPGMLGAVVSLGLFGLVGVTSIKAARRRLSYESWHGIHLYIYLAMALGFLHQLTIGADFVDDPIATGFWVSLYLVAFLPLLLHRVGWPIWTTVRYTPRVAAVVPEADGVFSLYVSGRDLDRLAVRSGQFFVIRGLTRNDWMHGHPFSVSAAPNGGWLRFTIKEFGEGTRALRALPVGTRLMLEGPYGAVHGARRTGRRLLFVAGGIGIAPIRAMVESFAYAPGEVDLVYRSRDAREMALRTELESLAARRGIRLHLVSGRRGEPGVPHDPLGPASLHQLVPDAATRDIYLCGPNPLMERARHALLALGADARRINLELFST